MKDNKGKDKFSILQTKEMIGSIFTGSDNRKNYKLPISEPVFYNKRQLPIDPYLLGILIGDGGMTGSNTTFTSADDEIVDRVKDIVSKYDLEVVKDAEYSYRIRVSNGSTLNYINQETYKLNLRCKSEYKFIPKVYLYSDIYSRINLLQGLMDTDGTVDKRSGCPTYSTSSEELKNNFCELIRSLGGIAT